MLEADAHSVKTEQVAGRGAGGAQSRHDVDAALEDPYEDPGEGTAIEGTAIGGTVIGDESFETPGRGASSDVPDGVLERLFSRCREHAAMWSAQEVTECVELANQGIMYQNHGDAGDADRSTVETTRATSTTAETEPMSLAAIISANLNMKEKLLLGACGSYLAWYVASRRQAGAASRLSRYRKQLRDKKRPAPGQDLIYIIYGRDGYSSRSLFHHRSEDILPEFVSRFTTLSSSSWVAGTPTTSLAPPSPQPS